MSIIDKVDEFMASSCINEWIGDEYIQVYVRKGHKYIDETVIETFDVANISNDQQYQGKGYFRNFMNKIESLGLPVYVECILNPKLVTMLIKNGYTIIQNGHSINAIKFTK